MIKVRPILTNTYSIIAIVALLISIASVSLFGNSDTIESPNQLYSGVRWPPNNSQCNTCLKYISTSLSIAFYYPNTWKVNDRGRLIEIIPPWSDTRPPDIVGDYDTWDYAIRISEIGTFGTILGGITKNDLDNSFRDQSRFATLQSRISFPEREIVIMNSTFKDPATEAFTGFVHTDNRWLQVNIGRNSIGRLTPEDMLSFFVVATSLSNY